MSKPPKTGGESQEGSDRVHMSGLKCSRSVTTKRGSLTTHGYRSRLLAVGVRPYLHGRQMSTHAINVDESRPKLQYDP